MHTAARAKVVARIVATVALLLASGSMLAGGPLASAGVPVRVSAAQPASKIAPDVLRATNAGQVAPIAILLADQANVSTAYSMTDRDARGRYVYNTLKAHADRTQAGLRAELDTLGVSYNSFWIANVIFAQGDRALVERLAARSDVKVIESNASRRMVDDPVLMAPGVPEGPHGPQAVEWNVTRVRAPEVWNMGYTGTDIVVGIQDTGMHWTHNALKPHYRGWNGASADHNYNWWDGIRTPVNMPPANECGYATSAPCDDHGHGTHVIGIAVGDDGQGNQIGVAPGAKWIGCRNMDDGVGRPETYTECFEFFVAPTDLAGQNPNPNLRPHVINNSWGCTPGDPPGGEGCAGNTLQAVVENTQAAGIMVVASSGNSGPNCSSIESAGPPSMYEATFSTGATDINNTLAGFSSRGPATYDGSNRVKPNISAPGVNIRSSVRSGNTNFGGMGGTSMASPHVAGAVALLWDAWPQLARDITATKQLLQNTADPDITVSGGPAECGGVPNTAIPNNAFGYGLLDAYAAVTGFTPPPTATATAVATATATAGASTPTPAATGTTTTGCAIQFADVPATGQGSTFYSFVRCLACRSIVGGYPCGGTGEPCNSGNQPYFRPGANVTRGQIAKMVALAADLDAPTGEQVFQDVPPGSTFYGPVQQLATAGYIGGYPCATVPTEPCGAGSKPYFRPGANATRGQLSKIVSETAQLGGNPGEQRFTDVAEDSPFFVWVNRLANQGVISGYPCGNPGEPCDDQDLPYFRPGANVTRGQTSKIVANTFYPNCQTP
ncbi:MAG: S8 family serine peptidase [Chloroflexota bacterium]|nr:S8 family serine peptidase [Chloroflexota bacterium]MDQ5865078.1 S8 family serine peptidase [Chloroflexota bacterium]